MRTWPSLAIAGGVILLAGAFALAARTDAPAQSNLQHKRYVVMVAGDSAGPPTPTPTEPPPTAIPTHTPTIAARATPIPAPSTFGAGTFLVGSQLDPGTYRTRAIPDGCYWERLSGLSGDLDDIIANDFTNGLSVVTILPSDRAFSSSRCGLWSTDLSRVTASASGPIALEGTLIVNTDISPGLWRSAGGDGCYWERLSGFSGNLGDIISNDFTTGGQVLVQVLASDRGFSSSRCGTWTRQ